MSFLTFVLLRIERERESGKRNLDIKEKCPQSYLSYFRRGSTGESFFYGLIDFVLFLVLAWGTQVSHVSVNLFFFSTRSKVAMVRLPAMNPAQKLTSYYLLPLRGREPHFRFGVPANHLASLSFPLRCPATWGHQVPTSVYPLCDLHSFLTVTCLTAWYCQFNGRIVLVLALRLRGLSGDNIHIIYTCSKKINHCSTQLSSDDNSRIRHAFRAKAALMCLALSAMVVEYTDCISAGGRTSHQWVSWIWHQTIW